MAIPQNDGPRRIVVGGWSDLGPQVLAELDEFLDGTATVLLMLDPRYVDVAEVRRIVSPINVRLEIVELSEVPEVVAAHAAHSSFHEVIFLGHRNSMTTDQADALTLLTLLAFGQVRQEQELGPVRMVAELLDQRLAPLAAASGADDFIVSDELTSHAGPAQRAARADRRVQGPVRPLGLVDFAAASSRLQPQLRARVPRGRS